MAQIHNNEVLDKVVREAKIQTSQDVVPSQLAEKIVPVLNVNPDRLIQIKSGTAGDATSVTIHTTHTTKRTFLINAQISVAKSALSDAINSQLQITPKGNSATTGIIIRFEPSTAAQFSQPLNLQKPLELEKSTTINVTNSTNTASIDNTGVIFFYEVEEESG